MKDIVDLIARLFLAFIFLYEAFDSIFYFNKTQQKMIDYGLTWNSDIQLIIAILVLLLGGVLLLIGYRVGLGVILLLAYWVPITFTVHDFWNADPTCQVAYDCLTWTEEYRRIQGIMFMKNLAIIGGLLMVWVNGSGRWSIKRLFATTKVPKKWS